MYNWAEFNINIPDNHSEDTLLIQCPKCFDKKQKANATLYVLQKEQSWLCKHCGWCGNLFQGMTQDSFKIQDGVSNPFLQSYKYNNNLSEHILEHFQKKRISVETLNHFKIQQSNEYFPVLEDYINCVVYPYFKEYQIANLVYFYGIHRAYEMGGIPLAFNYDKISIDHTILVFDELEVLSLYEAGVENVISLFGGYSLDSHYFNDTKNKILDSLKYIEDKIKDLKKITLALPNHERANELKDELLRRFGKERCWVIQPPEKGYTWNKILIDYGKEKLKSLLDTAKPIPVKGIFEVSEVEDTLDELYYTGFRKGSSTGYDDLDAYYTVLPGQWTILTGIPGHGKSNFLDALMVNLANYQDWRFAIFSPENQPVARHYASIMEKYYKQPFDLGKHNRISEEQKELGKLWLKEHFSIILPDEDANWSIDGVLDLAKVLVYRKGIKGLVIDPWNELDHSRPNNQTETEYVSAVLTKIRRFARNYDVHVWLVAHPAKLYKDKDGKYPVPTPYDISGSAHYRNKADNAITVWRNVGHDDEAISDIHVQKIRFKEIGKVGLVSLRYDFKSGSFIADVDQNKRQKALQSGEVLNTDEFRIKQLSDF